MPADNRSGIPAFRPHLKEFLEFAFNTFSTVSIWSNAHPDWIKPILEKMRSQVGIPGEFLFVRTKTKSYSYLTGNSELKRLKKIFKRYKTHTTHNTLILDNNPATYCKNYGNAIGIDTWYGNPQDTQLLTCISNITKWLPEFVSHDSVRHIHKNAVPYFRKTSEHF